MSVMNRWAIIHEYRRLVDMGMIPESRHYCGGKFITRAVGDPPDPRLVCLSCGDKIDPGLNEYTKMLGAIEDVMGKNAED